VDRSRGVPWRAVHTSTPREPGGTTSNVSGTLYLKMIRASRRER